MRASPNGHSPTVLMTADTVGGVWTYALELARALGHHGVKVVLATMGNVPTEVQRSAASDIETLILKSRACKLEWMQEPWKDVREAGEWLLELESAHHPDVIHLNGYAHGALPWSAPVLVVGHSCVWSWFHAVRKEAPPEPWQRYRAGVRRGLQSADLVTAPTEAMLSELRRHYGPFRATRAIYNARFTDALRPLPRERYVLTAGRLWDEAKNVHALDAAAAHIDWPVRAAGSVQNPDGGRTRFESLELLGVLSPADLAFWMGRASIYALPARYEPFGLTALEAAHSGCALVLGDIPSLREVWGDAALFVPPDDAAAISEAVNRLARDADLLREMTRRAARRAARYTIDRMVERYLSLYARIRTTERRSPSREAAVSAPESVL